MLDRRTFLTLLSLCPTASLGRSAPAIAQETRWLVYYSDQASLTAFDDFSLLVLESNARLPLRALASRGKTLLGYISLGEVESHRYHFNEVKREGILLQENSSWKGSFMVDLRDRRWTQRVIEELIPQILHRGFKGIFLDTLDNAAYLEAQQPKKYRGMKNTAGRLVRTIRRHYPAMPIMMNRAYELLPQVERHIDMVLGESVYADYDFKSKTYGLVPKQLYRQQVQWLKAARQRNPALKVFTLDYWTPEDIGGVSQIYREQRANGFAPYVATVELDRIIPEPPS